MRTSDKVKPEFHYADFATKSGDFSADFARALSQTKFHFSERNGFVSDFVAASRHVEMSRWSDSPKFTRHIHVSRFVSRPRLYHRNFLAS